MRRPLVLSPPPQGSAGVGLVLGTDGVSRCRDVICNLGPHIQDPIDSGKLLRRSSSHPKNTKNLLLNKPQLLPFLAPSRLKFTSSGSHLFPDHSAFCFIPLLLFPPVSGFSPFGPPASVYLAHLRH